MRDAGDKVQLLKMRIRSSANGIMETRSGGTPVIAGKKKRKKKVSCNFGFTAPGTKTQTYVLMTTCIHSLV